MGYRIYSNITCPNRRCYRKYWEMSSLIGNLLNVKHHAPYKSMYSKYQLIKILENCFQNMNRFSWIKLIPVLIHLKYWYYNFPHLRLPCLPHHPCQILPYPIETPLQYNPHHVLHRFPYFFLPHSTTRHHKYWLNQTICQAKSIKSIIKLYTGLNTLWILWVKHATHQKTESLRIHTGKKHRQIKVQRIQKVWIWAFR